MATLTLADNAGLTSVRITWVAPSKNGADISAYDIKFLSSTPDSYFDILDECDGSDPTVIANLYCDVEMLTLKASPFNL